MSGCISALSSPCSAALLDIVTGIVRSLFFRDSVKLRDSRRGLVCKGPGRGGGVEAGRMVVTSIIHDGIAKETARDGIAERAQ